MSTFGGDGPRARPWRDGRANDGDDDTSSGCRAYTCQGLLTPVQTRGTRHVVGPVAGAHTLADVELVAVVRVRLPVLALREVTQRAVGSCEQ